MTATNAITSAILQQMPGINKCQQRFIAHLFDLLLSLTHKATYLTMGRYGKYGEQTYRNQYSKDFDFKTFNSNLIDQYCGSERILLFDPSYISKSGKSTPGVGYFWSGAANAVKWGLEIANIAVGDIENWTGWHYYASRTEPVKKGDEDTLLDVYANLIVEQSESLQKISKTICFDAFFSKRRFVERICEAGFVMVSRLQKNAYLRYKYTGEQHKGKGRPKLYDGKIDPKNVNTDHFKLIESSEEVRIYEGIAHVRSLKRFCKIIIKQKLNEGKIKQYAIYFSTEETMDGKKTETYYRLRFQIEFIFKDGKGHLGLEDSQSRTENALDFHFNASLSTLNVAKAAYWSSIPKEQRTTFSIQDIKTRYANQLLLDRLILIYGKDPILEKNNPKIKELYDLGIIAA